MKKRIISEERNKHRIKSVALQNAYLNEKNSFERNMELKKQQDEEYKKFKFYDNLLKELNKNK